MKKRQKESKELRRRLDRAFKHMTPDLHLRRAVKKWGLRWLIGQYQCAVTNWSLVIDEVLELRELVAKMKAKEKK